MLRLRDNRAVPFASVKYGAAAFCGGVLMALLAALTACSTGRSTEPLNADSADHRPLPAIHFTIQVGAFSTVERAARFADRLGDAGLDAYHFIDDDGLSKVRFGQFTTNAEARRRATKMQARDLIDNYYIVNPGTRASGGRRDALQQALVRTAQRFIGTPYRWGGTSARSGFDCSGLTMTVYRLNGLELPRSAMAQYRAGTPVDRNTVTRGDLVFFTTARHSRISHVGIYTGGGQFIHAPGRGKSIRTASLDNRYFRSRYRGARRYY